MNRMGATAALKPSTSDEKQRQKLLWCVVFGGCGMLLQLHSSFLFQLLIYSVALVSMQGVLAAPEPRYPTLLVVTITLQDKRTGPSDKPCSYPGYGT